jgi:hypothetical protein
LRSCRIRRTEGNVLVAQSTAALAEAKKEISTINKDIEVFAISTDFSDAKSIASL